MLARSPNWGWAHRRQQIAEQVAAVASDKGVYSSELHEAYSAPVPTGLNRKADCIERPLGAIPAGVRRRA